MSNYILSCCSTADLSNEHFSKRDINYICFHFEIDGTEFPDDLGKSIPFKEFYTMMANGSMTKTSQVSAGEYIEYFEKFLKEGNLSRLTNAYNSLCVNTGQRVRVLDPKGEYEAEAVGINEKGELIVETDDGELNNIYSGEVSVRGIYGYI